MFDIDFGSLTDRMKDDLNIGGKLCNFAYNNNSQLPMIKNNTYTILEAAEFLGISADTLRRWDRAGKLHAIKTKGGHRRYRQIDLEKLKGSKLVKRVLRSDYVRPKHSNSLATNPISTPQSQHSFVVPTYMVIKEGSLLTTLQKNVLRGVITSAVFLMSAMVGKVSLATFLERPQPTIPSGDVLGINDASQEQDYTFTVNIPAIFNDKVTIKDLDITDTLRVLGALDVEGLSNLANLNQEGTLITSLTVADNGGLTITGEQELVIENTDKGSAQKIFKTFKVGDSSVEAGSNSDTFTFLGGEGIDLTLDSSGKKLTFTVSGDSTSDPWSVTSSNVITSDLSYMVGIGTTSPTAMLHVVGSATIEGDINLNGDMILGDDPGDIITLNGTLQPGTSIVPQTDLGSDLGSLTKRFNNIYVANINSNGGISTAGQAIFTYPPTAATYAESSVMVNPTTAFADSWLLGVGLAGSQRAGIDEDGDMVMGYSGTTNAPTTSYPFNVYGHSTTRVSYIDESGNMYLAGNLDLGGNVTISSGGVNPGFTTGSIPFQGASGLAQDNANLFWDDSSNELGVGTTAPGARLDSLATTEQLRLSYNVSNYSSFTVNSSGDITIAPSGSDTFITGGLTASKINKVIIVDGTTYAQTCAGINAAIDALGSAGGEIFLPEASYTCNQTITIDYNNTTIRGAGNGSKITVSAWGSWSVPGHIIDLNGKDYLTFKDFQIDGTNILNAGQAFDIFNGTGVTYSTFDGLYLLKGDRNGINMTSGIYNKYVNNTFDTFSDTSANSILMNAETNSVISNNVSIGAYNGYYLINSFYISITGNSILNTTANYGLLLDGTSYTTVSGNSFYNNRIGIGALSAAGGNPTSDTISSNNITHSTNYGIIINGSNHTITGNTIRDNSGAGNYGIWIGANTSVITGNTITGYSGAGDIAINLGGTDNVVAGNQFESNTSDITDGGTNSNIINSEDGNTVIGGADNTPDTTLELYKASGADSSFSMTDGDVAHGLTAVANTDAFIHLAPISSTAGGAQLTALSDTDAQAMAIRGIIGSTDPTDSTPAVGFVAGKSNGTTGIASLGALETAYSFANNSTTLLTILGNGSSSFLADTATTGNAMALSADGLTTGNGLYIESTSTAFTTGAIESVYWNPGSATTAAGDLMKLNIGANGTLGYILNVQNNGSTVFGVSQSQITSALPHRFTAAGDVAIAYDLQFTNQVASYIKSNASLYINAGEVFESNDLVLRTYNKGTIIADTESFLTTGAATISGQLVIGTTAPSGGNLLGQVYVTNSVTRGKALAMFNQTENTDILTASSSGTTRFTVDNAGGLNLNANTDADARIRLQEAATTKWNLFNDGDNSDRLYITDDDGDNGVYIDQDATSWSANSDIRLKENVAFVDNTLDKLKQIHGYTYNFAGSTRTEVGVIAQEIAAVFPELVSENKDGFLGVAYDRLAPILINAINDQQAQIENLGSFSQVNYDSQILGIQTDIATASAAINDLQSQIDALSAIPYIPTPDSVALEAEQASAAAALIESIFNAPAEVTNDIVIFNPDTDLVATGSGIFKNLYTQELIANGNIVLNSTTQQLALQDQALQPIEMQAGQVEISTSGDITLHTGRIIGNDQMRGQITLPAGETSIVVHKTWSDTPISVQVTPDYLTQFAVTHLTETGFIIEVSKPSTQDQTLYWLAIW